MPDLNKPIREEITRLTRKELKQALLAQKKVITALKTSVSSLKSRCSMLERECKAIQKRLPKVAKPDVVADVSAEQLKRFRPSSKTVKALRAKLGLSQADLAGLLGVSGQSVYLWERKNGPLQLRSKPKQALFGLRDLGKREAAKLLTPADGE